MTDELPLDAIQLRHSDRKQSWLYGSEAHALAYPDGTFSPQVTHEGRTFTFHGTIWLRGPQDVQPTRRRLVYIETP